jgi:hypothetical protein
LSLAPESWPGGKLNAIATFKVDMEPTSAQTTNPGPIMPFDPGAADRIRELMQSRSGMTERQMFGGIAFMANGHMAV